MERCARNLTLAVVILLLAVTGVAQPASSANAVGDEARIRQVVDGIMQPYLARKALPGAIVGVSSHGRDYFFPYGKATDAGEPFTPDTLVEIGSCTKVFTTTIFALAINAGQIDPDTSAQKYMPDGLKLKPGAQKMTPGELADFTSGMPDDPTNLPNGPLWKRGIEHYTTEDFLKWAASWTPRTPLPAPYKYSNAGIGLLSYLVAHATGKDWKEQLNADILKPLTMPDTELRPTPEQTKRLAKGHTSDGGDAPPWPVFAWYAGGGLRSTARDMLHFGGANLGHKEVNGHPVPPALTAAMRLVQQPIYTLPNGRNKQAMAWINLEGNPQQGTHTVIMKNGGTVGFGSVIVLDPFKDAAVFIAVNQSGSDPTPIGVEIARHLPK